MFIHILLFTILPNVYCRYVISVYGDVYNDQEFFGKIYPWIIDNIGGEISVDFYLQGSGKYSVPQMCVLNELKMNTFLQAQYLKCEAEDNPSDKCLCETGIDPEKYKTCVQTKGSYAGSSSAKYTQLGIDASPIIEIGYKNTIFGVEDSWYLKKICTIFGDNMPRGCIKPFSCNNSSSLSNRKGLVVYNCRNCKEDVKEEVIENSKNFLPYLTTTTPLNNDEETKQSKFLLKKLL